MHITQEFSDDEDETAEPNVPVVDEDMDETQNALPDIEIVDQDPETGPPGSRDESSTPAVPGRPSAAPESVSATRDASPQLVPGSDRDGPSPSVPHENEPFLLSENSVAVDNSGESVVPLSSAALGVQGEDDDDDLGNSAALFAQGSSGMGLDDSALDAMAGVDDGSGLDMMKADISVFDQEGEVFVADTVLDGSAIAEDVVNFVIGDGTS